MLHTSRTGGVLGASLVGVLLVAVLGLLVLTLLGREVHAAPAGLALGVLLLPYLYAGVGGLGVVLWIVLPDRRETPAILGVCVLAAFFNWAPDGARTDSIVEGQDVRLVSWNVRRLWGDPEDERDATACVARTLAELDPDVVQLMEVSVRDLQGLQEVLPMACVHAPYRESASQEQPGIASCVRGERWSLQGGAGVRYVDTKDWHYVMTEVGREGVVFNALAVHLTPYKLGLLNPGLGDFAPGSDLQGRLARTFKAQGDEAAALLERVGRFEDPTVVTGDFNSTRDTALHVGLRAYLSDVWERAGEGRGATADALGWLPLRVDFVYVTPGEIQPKKARVPAVRCSDHRPVVADLRVEIGSD